MPETTASTDAPRDPYAALRAPDYRLFLIGNTVTNIGRQALTLAASWQVYQWTKSPTALGLVGLTNFLPYIALALPAGHLADRVNRRGLIQATLGASAVFSILLALVSAQPGAVHDGLFWRGINAGLLWTVRLFEGSARVEAAGFDSPALAAVFVLLLVNAAVRTLGMPARASLVPLILPRALLANAITWSSSTFELTAVIGPTVAGFIIAGAGFTTVYLLDAALGLTMVLLLARIRYREPERRAEPPTLRSLGAGIGFMGRHREILAAGALDMFATLLGGAVALLPVYADEILGVGPVGLGWLRAAPSLGAIVMALALAHRAPMRRPGVAMLWAVAAFGAAIVVFGVSRWYWLSFAMLVLSGCFDNVSVVVRQSMVQLMTPDHLRGRVTAVNQMFILSSNEVGAFRAGSMAGMFGPVVAVVAGGVGTVLVVLGTGALFPQLKRLGRLHELKPVE